VVKHRNDIKIQIVHPTINMARQIYGENFSLLRRTVWLLPEFNTSLIGRGKNKSNNNPYYSYFLNKTSKTFLIVVNVR
jgi:hypothetical protein